ncbi:MAG: hypothetical protein ACOCV1_01625 [Bacillota bacterium]
MAMKLRQAQKLRRKVKRSIFVKKEMINRRNKSIKRAEQKYKSGKITFESAKESALIQGKEIDQLKNEIHTLVTFFENATGRSFESLEVMD